MCYMTDCYMDLKLDFEKSVINFKWQECCHCPPVGQQKLLLIAVKWQEYCHCPIRDISANNSKRSKKSVKHGGMVAFSYYLTVNVKYMYIATAL